MRVRMLKRKMLVLAVAVAVTIAMAPIGLMEPAHATGNYTDVYSGTSLQNAVNNGDVAVIPDNQTITVDKPITVSGGSVKIIMGAGSKLQYSASTTQQAQPIIEQTGGNLTITTKGGAEGMNVPADQAGEINVMGSGGKGIDISGGTLVFDGPKLTMSPAASAGANMYGIYVTGEDTHVVINDGLFTETGNTNAWYDSLLYVDESNIDVTINDGEFILDNTSGANYNMAIRQHGSGTTGKIIVNKALFRNFSNVTGAMFDVDVSRKDVIQTGSGSTLYTKLGETYSPAVSTEENAMYKYGDTSSTSKQYSIAVYKPISVDPLPSRTVWVNDYYAMLAKVNNGNNAVKYTWEFDGTTLTSSGITTSDYKITMPGSAELQDYIAFYNTGTSKVSKRYECTVSDTRYQGFAKGAAGETLLSASNSGTITTSSTPDAAAGFTMTSNTVNSIRLMWDYEPYVTKYILKYGSTSVDVGHVGSYDVTGLSPGTSYTFTLTPVITYNGIDYPAATAATLTASTAAEPATPVTAAVKAPSKVTIKTPTTKRKTITVKWKKVSCTGYQVYIAKNSRFTRGLKKYTVTKSTTLFKNVTKLKKGTRYYVKVRAYTTSGSTSYFGKWSKTKSIRCK